MSTRASRLGKNTLLIFFGNMGSKLIGLIMLPFYTSWLSVVDYGLTDIITVYVTFLFGIVTCCIGESLFLFPKGAEKEKQTRYFTSGFLFLLLALSSTALIFGGIEIVSSIYDFKNSFVDNIWLIYFMLLSQIVQQISQQFTRSIDKMKVYSITGIVCTVCTAAFAFVFIPDYGVEGYVWSIIIANVISGLFSFFASKSYSYLNSKSFDNSLLKEMLRYSFPLIPNGVMWWLVNALNRPLMEHHLGMHDIGIYAVANKFPGILGMVFTVFATSWQISVLEEFGKEGYKDFYNKTFRLIFFVLIIVLIGITLSSKLIVSLFADEEFFDAWQYTPILTLGILFSNLAGFTGSNFSATKESKYFFYSSLWGALVAIILNFIMIPFYGLYGACFSVLISFVVMAVSRIIYSWKYVKLDNINIHIFTILISGIIMWVYIKEFSVTTIVVVSLFILVILSYLNRNLFSLIANKFLSIINKK